MNCNKVNSLPLNLSGVNQPSQNVITPECPPEAKKFFIYILIVSVIILLSVWFKK